MTEDKDLILSTFGVTFENDIGRFTGLLGTDIVSLSGGTYEISAPQTVVHLLTRVMYDNELNPGVTFNYTYQDLVYNLTVTSMRDNLDGWSELYCDVGVSSV